MTPKEMADIHHAAFTHGRAWSADEFAQLLANTHTHCLSCEGGFAVVQVISPEVELLTIAVHPDHQRNGLGRALLADLSQLAARLGCDRVFLEVDERNSPAHALYAAAGFASNGSRSNYYRHADGSQSAAILMSCDLTAKQTGK